jgi:hypothetical protein
MGKQRYFLFGEAHNQLHEISSRWGDKLRTLAEADLCIAAEGPDTTGRLLPRETLEARRDTLEDDEFELLKKSRVLEGEVSIVKWVVVAVQSDNSTAPATDRFAAFWEIELKHRFGAPERRRRDETIRDWIMQVLVIEQTDGESSD